MHLLYVVEFVVEGGKEVNALDRLVTHVANWLSRGLSTSIEESSLENSGHMELASGPDGSSRSAWWEILRAGDSKVVRVDVAQQLTSGIDLTTRVTVGRSQDRVSLRIGMIRESQLTGALTPVGFTPVFQPALVGAVARDSDLQLRAGGQSVDDRYIQLPDPTLVSELAIALDRSSRLPVLLVHTRSQRAWDLAHESAKKLIGLVRVVTLSNAGRANLAHLRPNLSVPFGGARLVWSDSSASGPAWKADEILAIPAMQIRDAIMRLVAPISALYRGTDQVWQEVRRSAQREAIARAADRAEQAQSSDDLMAQVRELGLQVAELQEANDDLGRLAEAYAKDASDFAERATRADAAATDAKYWREMYTATMTTPDATNEDPWTTIPALVSGADPIETFLALEDASSGRIVFSEGASKSWKSISYPQPDDMLAKLTALARAAVQLYGPTPGKIGHIDDWFKLEQEINVSTNDDTIERSKSLKFFDHDGVQLDQTPHVKVRDGVKPNQVGRISTLR